MLYGSGAAGSLDDSRDRVQSSSQCSFAAFADQTEDEVDKKSKTNDDYKWNNER